MLSLQKQQPTILDYVGEWWGPRCACGKDIDVVWSPGEMDHDGQWADPTWFVTHCAECVVEQAPERHRPSLRERYKRLRVERLSLGLGRVFPNTRLSPIEPDPSARRSLRWESGTITLKAISWRKPAKAGTNDLVMEQLTVIGTIAEDRPSHLDLDAIAALPWFDLQVREPTGPLSQPLELASVLLGATVRDPKRPGLEWRYSWNRSAPASYGFFSLPPYWQDRGYSPAAIGSFVSDAMTLYEARGAPGAPRGVRNAHKYPHRLWQIKEKLGYRPSATEFRNNFHRFENEGIDAPPVLAESTLRKFLGGRTYDDWADGELKVDKFTS